MAITLRTQGPQGVPGLKGGISYYFSASTDATPPEIGYFKFNNTIMTDVTQVLISKYDITNTNHKLFYETNTSGNLYVYHDNLNIFRILSGSLIDNSYFLYTVVYLSGLSAPSNDSLVIFNIFRDGMMGETGPQGSTGVQGPQGGIGVGGLGISFEDTDKPKDSGVYKVLSAYDMIIPENCTNSSFYNKTNPSTTVSITLKKNGTTFGTISVTNAGVATFTTSETTVYTGDRVDFVFPAQDSTWAGIAVTLIGARF